MKILILSGSHSRHMFVHNAIMESGFECAAVVMQREELMPKEPDHASKHEKNLFRKHFSERKEIEDATFGKLVTKKFYKTIPSFFCRPESLNSKETLDFIKKQKADLAFIFGTNLIKEPILSALPPNKINLHLGLSPWYRGSATLFWPFYFLQPQYAGATFHQIIPEADAGDIVHQLTPTLENNDGIHDVAVKTVLDAKSSLIKIIKEFSSKNKLVQYKQKTSGRLFRTGEFHYSHLRLVYDLYENKIVDEYLRGNLLKTLPSVINGL